MISQNSLDSYFTEIDLLVREAYAKAGISAQARAATERTMFLKAEIPSILMPAVTGMLTTTLKRLQSDADPGKLYWHDSAWLGLTDEQRSKKIHDNHIIDVIRKLPLGPGHKLKRCARCGSVAEDINLAGLPQSAPWVMSSMKQCVCYSNWVVHDGEYGKGG
jgi:mediator of RNA polymerase II transcription subunit 16